LSRLILSYYVLNLVQQGGSFFLFAMMVHIAAIVAHIAAIVTHIVTHIVAVIVAHISAAIVIHVAAMSHLIRFATD
jgi:hypothetical protein